MIEKDSIESTQSRRSVVTARMLGVALLGLAMWATPADAITCPQWSRLSDADKHATIEAMVDDAIQGQKGRSYNVNRAAIGRCMLRMVPDIQLEFDDTCADARTASTSALNKLFKSYIWACVN